MGVPGIDGSSVVESLSLFWNIAEEKDMYFVCRPEFKEERFEILVAERRSLPYSMDSVMSRSSGMGKSLV